ncbi:hypothetical protein [Variovorax sp. DT-64]|uniref:hypothetical protein n=1 Tax=Variovorax sp. DT-64 TaxID=3396160 RepID=UPI003F1C46C2
MRRAFSGQAAALLRPDSEARTGVAPAATHNFNMRRRVATRSASRLQLSLI